MTGTKLADPRLAQILTEAGFSGKNLETALAIVLAESGGNPNATNTVGNSAGTDRGLFQINTFYHPEVTSAQAFDPLANAKAAFTISKGGTNFTPWATYDYNTYKQFIPRADAGIHVWDIQSKATKDAATATDAAKNANSPGAIISGTVEGTGAAVVSGAQTAADVWGTVNSSTFWIRIAFIIGGITVLLIGVAKLTGGGFVSPTPPSTAPAVQRNSRPTPTAPSKKLATDMGSSTRTLSKGE